MTHILTHSGKNQLERLQRAANAELARVVHYEGDRIYFRPVESSDEPLLRRWINDPRVWRGLCYRQPTNEYREREWIESQGKSPSDVVFGIVARSGDRLIGTCGLHRIDPVSHAAVLGISIGEVAFHNKGFGTETVRLLVRYGFEELNLNRVGLSVFANNLRAIRCYQKAGFVHEGCRRQALYRNGSYHDEYLFAILREEWENSRMGPPAD